MGHDVLGIDAAENLAAGERRDFVDRAAVAHTTVNVETGILGHAKLSLLLATRHDQHDRVLAAAQHQHIGNIQARVDPLAEQDDALIAIAGRVGKLSEEFRVPTILDLTAKQRLELERQGVEENFAR